MGDFPENMIMTASGSVRNSTCMMYHQPSSTREILFQFGGVISEETCLNPFPGTTIFHLDLLPNDQLRTISAKHLKKDWILIKPEYDQLTLGEERKQIICSSSSEQLMDMSDIGISIRVYNDVSVEGKSTEMEITVQPVYSGPIKIPEGYVKASPVYIIKESNTLMKKTARIKINHHVSVENEEDRRGMMFLQGESVPRNEQSKLSYNFSTMDGDANFEIGKDSGEISVRELTPMCVAKKCSINGNKTLYGLNLYYAPPSLREGSWDAILTMYLHQNLYRTALSSYMEQYHPTLTEKTTNVPVRFKPSSAGSDDSPKVEFLCSQGKDWTIRSSKNPKILYKEEVDLPKLADVQLEDSQEYPPKIKLKFTPQTEQAAQSECQVQVVGLQHDYGYTIPLSINKPTGPGEVISNEGYLHVLITILNEVAFKWKDIGLVLGFLSGDLACIEQSPTLLVKGPKAYFQELIRQWLEWTPPEHHPPTITALHAALKDPLVEESVLAETLLEKVKEVTDEGLCTLKKKYEGIVNTAIEKLEASTRQWAGNDMIQESTNVANLMKEMMASLQESEKMTVNSEEIERSCKNIARMAKEMIKEINHDQKLHLLDLSTGWKKEIKEVYDCANCVQTKSELLKKYVHIHHKSSIDDTVVAVDQMIRRMIDLANSMEQFWDCFTSVIKQIDPSIKEEKWRRVSIKKRAMASPFNAGFVPILSKRLEESKQIRPFSAYESTTDSSGQLPQTLQPNDSKSQSEDGNSEA